MENRIIVIQGAASPGCLFIASDANSLGNLILKGQAFRKREAAQGDIETLLADLRERIQDGRIPHPVPDEDIDVAVGKYRQMLLPAKEASITDRAARNYRAAFVLAKEVHGNGLIGLLPRIKARGNRKAKISEETAAVIATVAARARNDNLKRSKAYQLLMSECEALKQPVPSRETFYSRYQDQQQGETYAEHCQ